MSNEAPQSAKTQVPEVPVKEIVTPKKAPLFRITTPTHKKRYLKLMTYGDFGTGKTTLAGSASLVEQMKDVIFIDAESGDLSLTEFPAIDSIPVNTFKQVARIQEFLKVHCRYRDEGNIEKLKELEERLRGEPISGAPREYRTVVIDSLSEVESYCMAQLLGITDSTRLDEEVQGAEWPEYKKNHSMVQRLVRAFRDLPMNVIFICSQSYVQDENKKQKFAPQMTGKLATQVQGFMDMVGYLVVAPANEEGVQARRLYVQPSGVGKYAAKNRFAAFKGNHIDNPTMQSILTAVKLIQA